MIEQILLIVQWNIVNVDGVQKCGSVKFIFFFKYYFFHLVAADEFVEEIRLLKIGY